MCYTRERIWGKTSMLFKYLFLLQINSTKMKKLFLMAFTAITLFSCSNEGDDSVVDNNVSTFSLALKIERETFTRAMQTPGTGDPAAIQSMIIEVFDATYFKIAAKALSAQEIAGAMDNTAVLGDAGRIVFPNISSRAAYVKLWAFQSDVAIANLPVLGGSINDYQMAFDAIPFYPVTGTIGSSVTDANGFISINKSVTPAPGPNLSGNKIWTVEASLAPYFARFEMKPTLPTGGITAVTTPDLNTNDAFPVGTTIDITGIYMNNIRDQKGGAIVTNAGNFMSWGSGNWATGHPYEVDGDWSNMYNAAASHATTTPLDFSTLSDCYNLYAQAVSPHVIVRVMVNLPAGSAMANAMGENYYGFITLKDFKTTSGTLLSNLGVEAAKIYKVALDLAVKPSNIDSEPEATAADLYGKVTIVEWTEVALTPEL